MSSYINPNRLKIREKDFHCISVNAIMDTVEYQGGMYTVIDDNHPLKEAVDASWGDFLVIYENVLYYAITEYFESDSEDSIVVRLYNITDNSGDIKHTPDSTTPGWIIMDLKDLEVSIEDNTFLRWRYNNAGRNKTMDFRINQVQYLPCISSNIVGQIFWSLDQSQNVQISQDTQVTYEAGVYMCEDDRYVRLDFDENSPSFLKYQVKDMAIQVDPVSGDRYLHLYSYYYTDETGKLVEATINDDRNTICKINAEDWYKHIDVLVQAPTTTDKMSTYIPSDLTGLSIIDNISRDEYGHVTIYDILTNINLRYRWEEI